MREMKLYKAYRGHTLVKVLGIILLLIFMLMSIVGAEPYAYISCSDNHVYVIDTATNKVKATQNVLFCSEGVAVNLEGTREYVASGDYVSVIDTSTNKVMAKVRTVGSPDGIAVSPDGKKVYATINYDTNISVIDATTNIVKATVPVGKWPSGIAVTPDGSKVYVANSYDGTVSVINTTTNKVIATVDVGIDPIGVAISPDGKKAYVTINSGGTVSVLDTSTNTVTDNINVGGFPMGIAVSPDGTNLYVANNEENTVTTFNTTTNNFVVCNVGEAPRGVAVTPDGKKVYVTCYQDGSVSVIDTATNTVTATVNGLDYACSFGQFIGGKSAFSIADFTSDVTSGNAPVVVSFTDKSTGNPNTWAWNFGDGTKSTIQNPKHTYSKAGKYTVSLTVTNAAGSNTTIKSNYITVTVPPKPVAAFSASPLSGKKPLTVTFTDKSTGSPTSWLWNFGDKTTSIVRNPIHKYTKAGKYKVSLTVKNAAGSNTKMMSNYITVK